MKPQRATFGKHKISIYHMTITYLVSNYNNSSYLRDCIESLNKQTNSNWLCIIADDKSSDNSVETIQSLLNEKITLLKNEQNIGKVETLRKLITHATTDILGILDSDDALYPNATELILKAYQDNPTVGFVYSNYAFFSEDLTVLKKSGDSRPILDHHSSLISDIPGAIITFKRTCYEMTEGLNPDFRYGAEDIDLVFKMEEVTKFFFIDQILYKYRHVPNSLTNNPYTSRIGWKNHLRASLDAIKRRRFTGLRKYSYLCLAYSLYLSKNKPKFITFFCQYIHFFFLNLIKKLERN